MRRWAAALAALGGAVALAATRATWATVQVLGIPPLPDRSESVTGAELATGIRSLAVVALAAAVAVHVAPGWTRRLVGLVLLACGLGTLWVTSTVMGEIADEAIRVVGVTGPVTPSLAPWAAAAGGALMASAGAMALVRGHRWPGLSSAYSVPAEQKPDPVTDKGTWDALDRGEDPTA